MGYNGISTIDNGDIGKKGISWDIVGKHRNKHVDKTMGKDRKVIDKWWV